MRERNEEGGGRRFGGPRRGGFQRSMPPVRIGEELDVVIEAVGEKGDGIAKKNGFVLFIPGVKEGDNVRVRVTKVFRKVGFAEVVGEGAAPEESSAEEEEAPEESESFGEEEEEPEEGSEDFGEEEEEK